MRTEGVDQGLGKVAKPEEHVDAEYQAGTGVVCRKAWQRVSMPDNARTLEGAQGIVPDFVKRLLGASSGGKQNWYMLHQYTPGALASRGKAFVAISHSNFIFLVTER
jgi:hypothetical protein